MIAIPALEPAAPIARPEHRDETLPSGLRVLAVRRAGVPLVELRLRVPFGSATVGHSARAYLLAETLFAGAGEAIRALGAALVAGFSTDHLLVSGVVHKTGLPALLGLLGETLTAASYPADEVAAERARMAQRLTMARSRAATAAHEALLRHLYGDHPYARELPLPAEIAAVTPAALRTLHRRRVVPVGSALILVGDLSVETAPALAAVRLAGWTGSPSGVSPLPPLPMLGADPSLLVHRPGSVQSSIRIGGPALRRDDPGFPALQLANLIYGGYFSSRLVENIREDKGYTYTPHSRIDHGAAGSTLVIDTDVATEVTAPALLEMWYELGRLSTLRPTQRELDDVRTYAIASLAISTATQTGLASNLATLVGAGLDLSWFTEYPRRLEAVTLDDIYATAVQLLAPHRLAAVVIGDATLTEQPLRAFGPWEVRR